MAPPTNPPPLWEVACRRQVGGGQSSHTSPSVSTAHYHLPQGGKILDLSA